MLAVLCSCGPSVWTRPTAPPAQRAANPVVSVVVRPGDTVYTLAQQHAVPLRALIEANRLEPPYQLESGRVLMLPQQNSYTVAAGDTVYGISRRFGVDMSSLTRLNRIEPPFTLRIGQTVILPVASQPAVSAQPAAPTAEAVRPGASIPTDTAAETARPGIVAAPLPPPQAPAASETAPPPPPSVDSAPAAVPSLKPEPPGTPAALPPAPEPSVATRPVIAPVPPPASATVTPTPPRSGRGFLWPVNGKVVSDFGAKAGGLHNDGINIAVPRGTPVRAADAGVVAYAGNELQGFGNLLLIKHADGWVTAYAHNDRLLVKRGDTVRRGQAIAHVGATGSVSTPQLHFEIRKGPQAVDPRRYLTQSGA